MRGVGRIMVREDGWDEEDDLEDIDEEEDEYHEEGDEYHEEEIEYREEDNGEVRRIRTGGTVTTEESDVLGVGMSLVSSEASRFQSLGREVTSGSDGSYGSANSESHNEYRKGLRRRIGSGDWDRDR